MCFEESSPVGLRDGFSLSISQENDSYHILMLGYDCKKQGYCRRTAFKPLALPSYMGSIALQTRILLHAASVTRVIPSEVDSKNHYCHLDTCSLHLVNVLSAL